MEKNRSNMKRSDIIASLVLGEIATWLILAVIKTILPLFYEQFRSLLLIGLPIIFPILCLIFLYLAFLIARKITVIRQASKFVLVGGLNTLVDWGVLSFLIFAFQKYLNIGSSHVIFSIFSVTIIFYSLFKAISFILATTNSYIWNKFWTFKRKTTEKLSKEFLQFIVISIIGFLINVGLASFVFKFIPPFGGLNINQWAIFSAATATVVSMVWNFLGYKFIVFDVKSKTESNV